MSQTTTAPSPVPTGSSARRVAPLRPILWRLHFVTGFLAAPIVVWLSLTGILFAWNPQIESALYRETLTVTSERQARPLSEQLAAVTAAYPDHEVIEIVPPARPGATTAVVLQPTGAEAAGFDPAPGAFTAYVDPASATITGRIEESKRPDEWIRNLHSNFRLGPTAGALTELAASLVLVSLATGLYLWWPKTGVPFRRSLVPRLRGLRGGRRRAWRDFHSAVGILTLGAVTMMVGTGLTWTEYAGRWVDVAKDAVTAQAPTLRTDLSGDTKGGDTTSGAGEHGDHESGNDGDGDEADVSVPLDHVDRILAFADHADVELPYTITPPATRDEAWTVKHLDRRWPIREESVAVDAATGNVVDRLSFADTPLLDQATTLGIRFHEGELFGLANQIGLTVLALALIVLVVSGYVMWWRRRPAGAFAAPPKAGPLLRTVPLPLLIGFAALLVLLPTLGAAFVLYLLAEPVLRTVRRRPAAAG